MSNANNNNALNFALMYQRQSGAQGERFSDDQILNTAKKFKRFLDSGTIASANDEGNSNVVGTCIKCGTRIHRDVTVSQVFVDDQNRPTCSYDDGFHILGTLDNKERDAADGE